MKRIKQMLFYLSFMLCGGTTLLSSCVDDKEDIAKGMGNLTITLKLDVPQNSIPETRTMATADESVLNDMKILVFKEKNGEEQYAYTAYVDELTSNSVTAKLIRSTESEQYRLVLLANVKTLPALTVGELKANVLKKITFNTNTKWATSGGSHYIPMWGESDLKVITDNTRFSPVNLLRALAKIDVDCSTISATKFQLKHIYLYNSNSKAYAAPLAANLSGTTVTAPSIPDDASVNNALEYTATNNKYANEIYLAEAVKGNTNTLSTSTCIVIGGSYNQGAETFYRVDFIKKENNIDTYLDILRNKQYTINITSVSGAGYSTQEAAFNARAVNMTVDITAWDASGMQEVAFDGQYTLGVSQPVVTVDELINYVEVEINTTYEGGYELEVPESENSDNRFVVPYYSTRQSNTSGKKRIRLLIAPNNERSNPGQKMRSTTIYVKAGKLKLPITIQQDAAKIDIDMYDLLCPHSNCYVVRLRSKPYVMPVQYKGESRESVGDVNTVELLWEKPMDGVFGMITSLEFYDSEKKYAKFNITKAGNALIGVKDAAGKILWSWHIWVPENERGASDPSFSPELYSNPPLSKNDEMYLMTLNIGAMNWAHYSGDDETSAAQIGCLYQWGRKDPFPVAYSDIGQQSPSVFNSAGVYGPMEISHVGTSFQNANITPEDMTATPSTLYISDSSENLWVGMHDNLYLLPDKVLIWGKWPQFDGAGDTDAISVKTIYDPSPFGWKIPNRNEYVDFSTMLPDEYHQGWILHLHSSEWLPKGAQIKYKQGIVQESGPNLWLSSPSKSNVSNEYFDILNLDQTADAPAYNACPIRPVLDLQP